nr:DNA-binding protein HEXBP [Tanacetum cinerariifolium]
MVSKRQILARRKFKQETELFPKPEPTPPKDPNKNKKKKKSEFKRNKNDPKKPSSKKHPLRIPGMKPGDICFICKADNHIAKNCPEKAQWEKHKICLLCRQRGFGHSLATCPQPLEDGGTKYATCFICKEQGHLSKDCPKNAHGIYPKAIEALACPMSSEKVVRISLPTVCYSLYGMCKGANVRYDTFSFNIDLSSSKMVFYFLFLSTTIVTQDSTSMGLFLSCGLLTLVDGITPVENVTRLLVFLESEGNLDVLV